LIMRIQLPRSAILLTTALIFLIASLSMAEARSTFVPKKSSIIILKPGLGVANKGYFDDIAYSQGLLGKVNKGGVEGSKSSLSTAIFNLVKGLVGVGVLSLPAGVAAFGDAKSAIFPAIVLITIAGVLSGYNFSLMGRICALTSATSYSTAWKATIGASTSWIPAVTVTLMTFSIVLAYSIVLTETFVGIVGMVGLGDLFDRTNILLWLTVTMLLPLCLMKDLKSLAPFSLMGILGMLLAVGSMGVRYFDGSYQISDGRLLSHVATNLQPSFGTAGASAVVSPKAFVLLGMLSTAYMAHFNAPKFYTELEDNTIARYNKLVTTSFGISIAIFCVATALGFGTFGKACAGFVLSNYASKDSLIGLSRIAVAFSLIFTYPLVFVGCRDGVMDVLHVPSEKRTNAYLNKMTFAILGVVTVVANVLDDVSFVLSFGGATLGNALIYVMPALMFRKVVQDMGDNATEGMKNEVYFTNCSCLVGIVMGVIGTHMALK